MLQVKKVSHSYSGNRTLKDISFTLKQGQIISLLGENGAGKSTLLKLIAGRLTPDSGEIIFDNKRVKGPEEQLIPGQKEIKIIYQDFKLAHRTTVWENIISLLPPVTDEVKERRTNELIAAFHLKHLAEKKVESLSGGEKQRLAIARALADEPKLVLMDEPFSSLDALTKKEISTILFEALQKFAISAIIVTHDYSDALKYSDFVGIMKNGSLVQIDTPRNVYLNPENEYAAHLTGPVNVLKPQDISFSGSLKKQVYVRPEQLVADKDGKITAIVKSVLFAGPYYEVTLTIKNGINILVYMDREPAHGEKIKLTVRQ